MRNRLPTEFACAIAATCLCLGPGAVRIGAAEAEMDLPEWTEEDASKFAQPGSALLGGGLWPIDLQPLPVPAFPEDAGEAAKAAKGPEALPEEMTKIEVPKIVITRGGNGMHHPATDHETEEALGEAGEVPEEFRDAYFGERPRAFLTDPQQLLSEQKTNDLRRFLDYHEGESEFAIYAFIFGGRQDLPAGISLRDLHDEWFRNEDVVLVAYFLGEPKRSVIEFGDTSIEALGAETAKEALKHCIEEAGVAQNPFNQLERFCIELSIRLYWIEKNNGMGVDRIAAAQSADEDALRPAGGGARVDLRDFAFYGLCFAGVLGGVGWISWRRLNAPGRTFVFPDFEITPRLSAPHSGGAHAVMFFGKKGG